MNYLQLINYEVYLYTIPQIRPLADIVHSKYALTYLFTSS